MAATSERAQTQNKRGAGTKPQVMAVRPLTVEVRSESRPGESYTVTLPHCTCPDFMFRHNYGSDDPYCKHLKAAMERVAGWHKPELPLPEECPACGGSRSERFYVGGARDGLPVTCSSDWHDQDAEGPGYHKPGTQVFGPLTRARARRMLHAAGVQPTVLDELFNAVHFGTPQRTPLRFGVATLEADGGYYTLTIKPA
jgi:hypothetical protein